MLRNHGVVPKKSKSAKEYYGSCYMPEKKNTLLDVSLLILCIAVGILIYYLWS